jgi:hypothetical protein
MKLRIIITLLTLSFGITVFSQETKISKVINDLTVKSNQVKYTHIYMIVYKDKSGNHLHEPKKVYRSESETLDEVKKRVAQQEKGRMYKLNTYTSINKDRPYGLLYSTTKNGKISFKLGTYTTKEYANKMCEEKERYGGVCIEVISLN